MSELSGAMLETLADLSPGRPRWMKPRQRRRNANATVAALVSRGLVETEGGQLLPTRTGLLVADAYYTGLSYGRLRGMVEQRERSTK